MPLELRLLTGLALAAAVVYATTPLAIRVADRLQFYDQPVGYKAHGHPTPYLGGSAVVGGFVVAVVLLSTDWTRTLPLLGGTLVMWIVGTWDDRRSVTPLVRLGLEVVLAALIWQAGLGWDLGLGAGLDLAFTAAWIVAVVNAFNLFDNMDGATPSMGMITAGGLALLGIAEGDSWLALAATALTGACAGFLPHNLTSPSRIFLGDGGSMPIGFAVAALTMIGVADAAPAWQSLAMGLLFVGVPALDTGLVMISRRRRGISLLTGGRDHLTHRAKARLRTARAVALALGTVQAVTSALAVVALKGGASTIAAAIAFYLAGAGVTIAVLDTRWDPVAAPGGATAPPRSGMRGGARAIWMGLAALVPLAVALGLSPYFRGYYESAIWVPAGLVLVVALTASVIARPARLGTPAVLLLLGVAALGVWSLASAGWADSGEQAVIEGNRLFVYAAFTGLLLAWVRTDRAAIVLVAALGAMVTAVALVTLGRLLAGSAADELFLYGRLDQPLGYANGQGCFYLLGAWCCLAVAEQRRSAAAAGLGLAGVTACTSLVVLTQSRGLALAALVSVAFVLAVVPGRLRRLGALLLVAGSIAAAMDALLGVFESRIGAGAVALDPVRRAAQAALLASLAAGVAWWAANLVAGRFESLVARLRPVAIGAVIAAALALVVAATVSVGSLASTLDKQYTAFTHVGEDPASHVTSTRLASGTGNRYDYWRIAWAAWRERPLTGVGAGNFDRPYFELRRTTEDVRQPHSLQLQALSELGLPGLLLLAVALAGLGLGGLRLARAARRSRAAGFLAVAGLGGSVAWLAHTSVDWMHLLPGVTGIALVCVVVLVRDRPGGTPVPRAASQRRRLALAAALTLVLALAGFSLSRQGLAEYFRGEAQDALAARPAETLRQADRSLRLDPEATQSYYLKAAALARFGEAGAARSALEEAARREPENFVTWALLGDLALRMGDRAQAGAHYRHALRLNPRDEVLRRHLRRSSATSSSEGGA